MSFGISTVVRSPRPVPGALALLHNFMRLEPSLGGSVLDVGTKQRQDAGAARQGSGRGQAGKKKFGPEEASLIRGGEEG
jgi:hypothetical protein